MTIKAQDRSNQFASYSRWQMLVRHPLLLKALTWLSSLTIMANASVSWAEVKPIEITSPGSTATLFRSTPLQITAPTETLQATAIDTSGPSSNNQNQSSKHKKLHNDLIGANNFTVAVQKKSSSLRRTYRSQPGTLTTSPAVKTPERQLVSSLVSNVQPQIIKRVSYKPDAAPELIPLPDVTKNVTPVRSRFLSQPRKQPQVRVEKPQSLASLTVPTAQTAIPLYVAPPQSTVVPQLAAMPTVSRPSAPQVAPLPTVQVAQATSIAPASLAMSNYSVNSDFIYPLATPAPLSSPFGWRVHPITGNRRFHAGQDLAAPSGTPIVAVANGRVVVANWHGGYGKTVVIEHNGRLQTLYGHMSEIFVQEGQEIKQGTVIGQVGSTGASTGPHLHFETKLPTAEGWVAVDPAEDLRYALNNLEQAMRLVRRP
jgi:murein DD-endopeptidase MepM/ murein hydrolase activator NlpD